MLPQNRPAHLYEKDVSLVIHQEKANAAPKMTCGKNDIEFVISFLLNKSNSTSLYCNKSCIGGMIYGSK